MFYNWMLSGGEKGFKTIIDDSGEEEEGFKQLIKAEKKQIFSILFAQFE
mgnify:CR=1 FL=1